MRGERAGEKRGVRLRMNDINERNAKRRMSEAEGEGGGVEV